MGTTNEVVVFRVALTVIHSLCLSFVEVALLTVLRGLEEMSELSPFEEQHDGSSVDECDGQFKVEPHLYGVARNVFVAVQHKRVKQADHPIDQCQKEKTND